MFVKEVKKYVSSEQIKTICKFEDSLLLQTVHIYVRIPKGQKSCYSDNLGNCNPYNVFKPGDEKFSAIQLQKNSSGDITVKASFLKL